MIRLIRIWVLRWLFEGVDKHIKSLPKRDSYETEREKRNATRYYMKLRFVRDYINVVLIELGSRPLKGK